MLRCFHDYTSPASAVAVARLQRLADEGLDVVFEGIELLPLEVATPVTLDVLAELRRVRPAAESLGVELHRPARRPPTVRAHVVGVVAEHAGLGASWRATCYAAYWQDGADLSDLDVLAGLATQAGLEPAAARAAAEDGERVRELRRHMASRRSQGVGGVPLLDAGGTFVPADLPEDDLRALAAL